MIGKSFLAVGLAVAVGVSAFSQEYVHFVDVYGGSTGTAGWDAFSASNPGNYIGPHAADILESNLSGSFVGVTAGGFKSSGSNLYAFFSSPTWTVGISGAETTWPFMSVGLQIAVTPPANGVLLTASHFSLEGQAPDSFIFFGTKTGLSAGGGQPPQPVNYYWASWDNLAAGSAKTLTIGPGGSHAVFAAARVDYVNTADASYRISAVPEAGSALAVVGGITQLVFFRRRRPIYGGH